MFTNLIELDEIFIYNRSLNSSEVSSLYNDGDGLAYPFGSGSVLNVTSSSISSVSSDFFETKTINLNNHFNNTNTIQISYSIGTNNYVIGMGQSNNNDYFKAEIGFDNILYLTSKNINKTTNIKVMGSNSNSSKNETFSYSISGVLGSELPQIYATLYSII